LQRNDLDSATKLVKAGVRITQPVVSFTGYTAFNTDDKGLKALGELLKISAVSAVTLHTAAASKATADGYQALMAALKSNATLTDLTLAKAPKDDLRKHEGGWVGPKAAGAIAEWLQSNTSLRRLNLSRNIKLGGPGLTQLAKGLVSAENSALQELYLSEVGGEPKSMAAIADALATGETINSWRAHSVYSCGCCNTCMDRARAQLRVRSCGWPSACQCLWHTCRCTAIADQCCCYGQHVGGLRAAGWRSWRRVSVWRAELRGLIHRWHEVSTVIHSRASSKGRWSARGSDEQWRLLHRSCLGAL
jgi:hypothetical protein